MEKDCIMQLWKAGSSGQPFYLKSEHYDAAQVDER